MYGKIRVEGEYPSHKIFPLPLLTATPSRNYFARGFLWDEGFHNLVICKWSVDLCLISITNWLDTMDDRGWIPRE